MKSFALLFALASAALVAGGPASLGQVRQIGGTLEARLAGACQSIDARESQTLSMGDARVRRGGVVRTTGVKQTIYVEEGGTAEIQGTGSTVYVLKGGRATISGIRTNVVAEQGGSVMIVGSAIVTIVDDIVLQVHQKASDCR